jgi:hypothetical protein
MPDLAPEPVARPRQWARCAECGDPVWLDHGHPWRHETGWHACTPGSTQSYATPA